MTEAVAVEVTVAPDDVDLASGLLWATGIRALTEHSAEPEEQGVVLRTDVPPSGIAGVVEALGPVEAQVRIVSVEDHLDEWRAHARVVRAGRRLAVHPPWVPLGDVAHDEVVVEIDPGRSWGHGAHPTSRLCLGEVERLVDTAPGCRVIDVGCGSGVLSITAAMLGAGRVDAVDIDAAACRATADNATRNGVTDRVHVAHVDDASDALRDVDGTAEVLVANLGAAILVDLAPRLLDHVGSDGTLVLSGLLDPPPAEVVAAFAPRRVVRTVADEGWVVLVVR